MFFFLLLTDHRLWLSTHSTLIPLKSNTRNASSYSQLFHPTWNCLSNCYSLNIINVWRITWAICRWNSTDNTKIEHDGTLNDEYVKAKEINKTEDKTTSMTDYLVWHQQNLSIYSMVKLFYLKSNYLLNQCLQLYKV